MLFAASTSIPFMTPWACVLRTIQAWACPGRLQSSVYFPFATDKGVILLAADGLPNPEFLQCDKGFGGRAGDVILHMKIR